MNIIAAIKSGKPFKRKSWALFRDPFERGPGYNAVTFELDDLTADDWEIQEPNVTLTSSQFWAAAKQAIAAEMEKNGIVYDGSREDFSQSLAFGCLGELAKRLGLTKSP